MKKILSLILAAMLLCTSLVGCSGSDDKKKAAKDEDKGAIIQTYLSANPVTIDPSSFYVSAETIKVMGLIYEGLTTVDDNGKVQKALAKEWEYEVDEHDDYLKLEITLKNSRWSDGIIVDADDFIYAWTRILLPESKNDNAVLLYPILNAKNVKEGLCSINDLGVSAVKDNVIEIIFEKDFTDVEYFLKTLASPALVPLREEVVAGEGWSSVGNTSYITNGPFKIKYWTNSEFTLERSLYFRSVSDNEGNKDDKVVKPYQLVNDYSKGRNPGAQYERFKETDLFYLSLNGAPKETFKAVSKKAQTRDLLSTYCLFFNLNDPLFEDARVRQALSLAIDRTKLANIAVTDVTPATGLVPAGIEDVSRKKDFRKEGGNLISAKSDMDKAKSLLKEAGVSDGEIVVECNSGRAFEETMIYFISSAWKELGFKVTVNTPNQNYLFNKANGNYEFTQNGANVLAMDMQSMTTDAYGMLMSFSSEFGGKFVDVTTGPNPEDVVYGAHWCGYSDADYDELCRKIYTANNTKERTAAMHEAEKYLVEQMPVIPLFFNTDTYITQKLKNVDSDKFGRLDLTKTKQSSYKKYLPKEED